VCIVKHKPNLETLVDFEEYVKEKRQKLRDLFLKNVAIARKVILKEEQKNQRGKIKMLGSSAIAAN
jgi:hypothetical protein